MAGQRLTDPEFHWFGKGQLLARCCRRNGPIELEPSAALVVGIAEETKGSFTGHESFRRAANRLVLDVGGIKAVGADPDQLSSVRYRIEALCYLPKSFAISAVQVEAWKRL